MNRSILLALCLNVALAAVLWFQLRTHPTRTGSQDGSSEFPRLESVRRVSPHPRGSVTNLIEATFHWSQVESEDYRDYAAKLRAIGCPEETVRHIITADIDDMFNRKVKELVEPESRRFWELMTTKGELEKVVEEKADQLKALGEERKQLLNLLVGTDDPTERRRHALGRIDSELRYSFLSDEQIRAVHAIEAASLASQKLAFDRNAAGEISVAERDRLNAEAKTREQEQLMAVLTPDELQEYRLRRTPAAVALRRELADLDVTDDETRKIAAMRAEGENAERIRQLLGSERYGAFERARDQNYRQTLAVMDRYELPSQQAVQLYEMKRAAEAQASSIRGNSLRSEEERQALLTAIQEETQRTLESWLEPRVYQAYRRNAGDWIHALAPQ